MIILLRIILYVYGPAEIETWLEGECKKNIVDISIRRQNFIQHLEDK